VGLSAGRVCVYSGVGTGTRVCQGLTRMTTVSTSSPLLLLTLPPLAVLPSLLLLLLLAAAAGSSAPEMREEARKGEAPERDTPCEGGRAVR
jgi:hypothetical protein